MPLARIAALSLFALDACRTGAEPQPRPAPQSSDRGGASLDPQSGAPANGTRRAAELLAALEVKPAAPHAGYERDAFGSPWHDVDRNGCDTRDDILRRDLRAAKLQPGARACVVESGRLADPYTGTDIEFVRGRGASVDIDHVVALGNAWTTGAAAWEPGKRLAFANDPLNLLAVDARTNRAKGDDDASTWLPPNRSYHCAYIARQIAVKAKYRLWATPDERDAWSRVLGGCPDEPAPAGDAPTVAAVESSPRPAPAAPRDPAPPAAPPAPKDPAPAAKSPAPNYGTCKEAKAHGGGPYVRGRDPEYAYYQDRDGDGVVCE